MRFGIIDIPQTVPETVKSAQIAEASGFDFFGIGDSQSLYRELYSVMAMVAANTTSMALGPTVTNVVTRDPAVTASGMVTIGEISGGRAVLGMGSGDSAVLNVGRRPSRLSELRDSILLFKQLFSGIDSEFRGRMIRARWHPNDLPIYLAAEGPKTIELAGELADGVILGLGVSPSVVELALKHLEIGASRAGRSVQDIDIWQFVRINIGSDLNRLIDELKPELASSVHHTFRYGIQDKGIPPEYVDLIRHVRDAYLSEHMPRSAASSRNQEQPNAGLLDNEEVCQYLVDRFALVGTTRECVDRLRALQSLGIDQALFTGFVPRRRELIETLGREIRPQVQGSKPASQ